MTLTFRLTLNKVIISQCTMTLPYKGQACFVRMLKAFNSCESIGEGAGFTCHCDNGKPSVNGKIYESFDFELAAPNSLVGFIVVFPREEDSSSIFGKTVFVIPDFTNPNHIKWQRTESFYEAVLFIKNCFNFRTQLEDAFNPEMQKD